MWSILGAVSVFFSGFFSKLAFFNVNRISYKNFLMFLFFLNGTIELFLIHTISGYEIFFDFLFNPFFYLTLSLEIAMVSVAKKNHHIQDRQFSNISFVMLSSIYLIPIFSYFYFQFLPVTEGIIKVFYGSFYEAFALSFVFFVLNFIYFYDKIKFRLIDRPFLLLVQALLAVNTIFFSVFMIQKYEGFMVYVVIIGVIALMYLTLAMIFERKHIRENRNQILSWKTLLVSQFWVIGMLFQQISGKLIAAEFVTFVKRLGEIINGYIFDRFAHKRIDISRKDIVVICLISIIMVLVFVYYNFMV